VYLDVLEEVVLSLGLQVLPAWISPKQHHSIWALSNMTLEKLWTSCFKNPELAHDVCESGVSCHSYHVPTSSLPSPGPAEANQSQAPNETKGVARIPAHVCLPPSNPGRYPTPLYPLT
jgi:hypothetical protein